MKVNSINNKSPYVIGITGAFGTGKSYVGNVLKEQGLFVVDTDEIVGDILRTKNNVSKKIVTEFGENILSSEPNQYINKVILGNFVFKDGNKRKILESIVHPEVLKVLEELLLANNEKDIIAVLIPLLFECNLEDLFDEVWCVICQEEIQIERLLKKGYSLEDIKIRISAQLPQEEKAKRADFVIDNSKAFSETKEIVLKRLKLLAQSNHNLHLSSDKEC